MSGENKQETPEQPTEEPVVEEKEAFEASSETLEAEIQGFHDDEDMIDVDIDRGRVAELENQLTEMKNKWMRAVAEEQNVRRRSEKEKQDALKYGVTNFARDMVSVADNMRRAMESAPAEMKDSDFIKGVEMTERELQTAFNKAGIKRIDAVDQPFDHNLHQAMYEVPDETRPAGIVAQVMQDGYVIHDRLLRPAMVGVTKGGPKYVAPADEEAKAQTNEAYEQGEPEAGAKLDQET